MKILSKERTSKTPMVLFDASKGLIEIKGRSIPENAVEFYKPLLDWLDEYINEVKPKTEVDIHLEYFNTSSVRCILDFFRKLEAIQKINGGVTVNWYYDEDDIEMLEAGKDYESIIHIPFIMKKATD